MAHVAFQSRCERSQVFKISENETQVGRWGDSLAIRLTEAIVAALNLNEGDDITADLAGVRTFQVSRKPSREERLALLRNFRSTIPGDFKFDREEANFR